MARQLRLEYEGALYHITSRGNARADIFLDDEDRTRFLKMLEQEIKQQRWLCYAYCLMDNHYHLLIETPEPNLGKGMRRLNQVYTQSFNRRHHQVGHVFQGRYKAIIVDKDHYLLELTRYIVLNPVRAGMVRATKDWRWSSYRVTAGINQPVDWLQSNQVLQLFGRRRDIAKREYRKFVSQGMKQDPIWSKLRGQIFLGNDDFLEQMGKLAKKQHLENVPRAQALPNRPDKRLILEIISKVYAVDTDEIISRQHGEAYQTAAWLLRRGANLSLKDTATLFSVSPSRISHIQRAIESQKLTKQQNEARTKCKVKQ